MENFGELLARAAGLAFVIELVIAIVLVLFSYWLEYTLRKPTGTFTLGSAWIKKYHRIYGLTEKKNLDTFDSTAVSCVSTFLILFTLMTGYFFTGAFVYGAIVISSVLTIVFAPRFVTDICKSLKYNRKTGDSDRINKLEKEQLAISKELVSLKESK